MSASSTTVMNRKRKQRVDVACDFCRKRKLGCDNAKPKCENCYAYQKDCTYAVRVRKERPSNPDTTNHVREEIARLSQIVENLHSALDIQQGRRSQDGAQQLDIPGLLNSLAVKNAVNQSSSRAPDAPRPPTDSQPTSRSIALGLPMRPPEAQFHGPTSVMFDGHHPGGRDGADLGIVANASEKNQLLAEATKQRQLEVINLRLGKLDFAGVDPKTGMNLLAVFWNRQHATGSVVYRPAFMRDMASQGPYFSELLLNAMYFVASKHISSGAGSCETAELSGEISPFRRKMEGILYNPDSQLLCKSSTPTIQALLLFSDALFSWCDEKSLSWHYLGIAINMIIDLGIHSGSSRFASIKSCSPENVEVRRRLFWGAFVLDKIQSIYQGRPARLRNMDNSVPILFLDEYEELEAFDTTGYSASPGGVGQPTHGISTFEHLCKLSTIADNILSNLYAEQSTERDPQGLLKAAQSLQNDLERWRGYLPVHLLVNSSNSDIYDGLGADVALPHILCLTLMYHSLLILLHRPFVSEGHLKPVAEIAARDAFLICESAASDMDVLLRMYKAQWCIKSPPYFLSYATYVSATIHVRVAAQKPSGSHAHQCLLNCLEILSEHQNVCHAPRRSMGILLRLMKRLKVDVGRHFTAYTSRTAGSEIGFEGSSEHANSRGARFRSVSGTVDSQAHALDPVIMTATETATGGMDYTDTNAPEAGEPVVSYGFEGQLEDMYFDLDPLFGFDIFQPDLGTGFAI